MNKIFFPWWCTFFWIASADGQQAAVSNLRLADFYMQSSAVITGDGSLLSSVAYESLGEWVRVKVPCTVLTGLVANNIYPNPYIGLNNMLIPDANDSFNLQYHLEQYSHLPGEPNPWKKPYWFITRFPVPANKNGNRFDLIFKGINYRAEVWLNGQRIRDSSQMAGMFAQYDVDVTGQIKTGADNALAVKIFPLDYPGLPAHPQLNALGDFYQNGGPTGDIGKNVTMLSSVGWDWIPEVHDRNIGIWQPVYLRSSGLVVIKNLRVVTSLPRLPDTSEADIALDCNLSSDERRPLAGILEVDLSPVSQRGVAIHFSKKVLVSAGDNNPLHCSPDEEPVLRLSNPSLWWPNGYGQPNLYRLTLRLVMDGKVSDDTTILIGIRTVSSSTDSVHGFVRRSFFVNGRKVHLLGGAWVPDMMLNRDSLRYDYELHLCQNANVNLVRVWGGGIGETDDFYTLADRYGLMVWQDFWITGDTHGQFKGSPLWPLESRVFIDNVTSTILRIRNHPSLLVWTGGNEGHARQELYNAMRDQVANLDGTRPFIPCSSGFSRTPAGWKKSWPDDQPSGVYSGGPYSWQPDEQYFKLVDNQRDWLFKDETGMPSAPPYNTISKIIPDLAPDKTLPFPFNNSWGYHDACTGNGKFDTYYQAMEKKYGPPLSIRDFCDKMQLLNAAGYRSIFEAVGHRLAETGGVMLWKLNAAFPSVIWQVYDWYLEPNAGYYFMKRACEGLHIQLNLDDSAVAVVNRTYASYRDLQCGVVVMDMEGQILLKKNVATAIDPFRPLEIFRLKDELRKPAGIRFVLLSIKDKNGKPISQNVYWMAAAGDFTRLRQMPQASAQATLLQGGDQESERWWSFRVSNPTRQLAFFLNPQIIKNDQEVLPSFWSDNYFSLAPGESTTVTVRCPLAALSGGDVALRVEGWNVPHQTIRLP